MGRHATVARCRRRSFASSGREFSDAEPSSEIDPQRGAESIAEDSGSVGRRRSDAQPGSPG